MADLRVRLVINPRAGGGAASRQLPRIVRAMEDVGLAFTIARTLGPGDATRLAREAFDESIDVLAVAGGDGSLNEAVQAYVAADGEPRGGPDLALIPVGTGGDFKRSIGLSGQIEQAVERIASAEPRPVDLPIMHLTAFDGSQIVRSFINITSFGIGGVTDKLVNEAPKWLGGKASFFLGTFRAFLGYRNQHVRVRVDGRPFVDGPVFNVAMANGRFFGGGMMIAPDAELSDGQLDVISLGDLSRLESLSLSGKIYKGGHIGLPKVTRARGARIEAEPVSRHDDVLLDMDGETPGKLPISVQLHPQLLRVRA